MSCLIFFFFFFFNPPTPIIQATKGTTSRSFFSLPEFYEWKQNTDNWATYKVKYYKGE